MRDRNPDFVAIRSLARWEKQQHGKCGPNRHVYYRVRRPYWVEVRCKLCRHWHTELYEDSFLQKPKEVEAA